MSKLTDYVGWVHVLRENLAARWAGMVERVNGSRGAETSELDHETNFRNKVKEKLERLKEETVRKINQSARDDQQDFSHISRPKTRLELIKVSAAVMGIEFSYAAETAFVSPLLLNIGLRHRHMTLMWCLSPLLGLFITPLLGSLSDGCKSSLGRRRPFIILLSIGIILGLILVPNGKKIGLWLGDTYKDDSVRTELPGTNSSPAALTLNLTESFLSNKNNNSWTSSTSPSTIAKPIWQSTTSSSQDPALYSSLKRLSSKTRGLLELQDGVKADTNKLDKPVSDAELEAEFWKARKNSKSRLTRKRLEELLNDDMWEAESGNNTITGGISNETILTMTEIATTTHVPRQQPSSERIPSAEENASKDEYSAIKQHPWGLIVTVLGTVLLDFDADACQSPSRAYMLDVTIPEDHARGLSTFTIMAGLGGSMGYFLGALNWENTFLGDWFGGHVRAVFTLVLFLFIGCVVTTIRSFREIPTNVVAKKASFSGQARGYSRFDDEKDPRKNSYGTLQNETSFTTTMDGNIPVSEVDTTPQPPTVREYIKTIVQLPRSLQWLCLTNFFSWMSLVCYSLYFTDFVGEAVFGGDPTAPMGSEKRSLYEDGVRFGCWGMSLYSLSCSFYSFVIEKLIRRFGAKRTYISGQLVYSVGMVFMTITRHPIGVIVFSWTAGIMYATLFTMPYLLVARYHASETFDVDCDDLVGGTSAPQLRGLGTDVAVVSSMVFLAQITQSLTLGNVVALAGTTTAIILAAAVFAACGALAATKVLYLDL